MSPLYDSELDQRDHAALDANDSGEDPGAVVWLPRRVPIGFHGRWVVD